MTQVLNTCDSLGRASGEEVVPLQVECFPKLWRRVPSIVVQPTDGEQVESGELRWPPDDVSSDVTESLAQVTGVPLQEAGPEEQVMGGV
ncbi:LBH domain-containing protein 2-like [Eleginops maclovinus]|uniref:LBH domain-containing protein 2-like n=1 Tax=Eleginops maclovinus TaxID=56733 RepID=UPI003080EF5D